MVNIVLSVRVHIMTQVFVMMEEKGMDNVVLVVKDTQGIIAQSVQRATGVTIGGSLVPFVKNVHVSTENAMMERTAMDTANANLGSSMKIVMNARPSYTVMTATNS